MITGREKVFATIPAICVVNQCSRWSRTLSAWVLSREMHSSTVHPNMVSISWEVNKCEFDLTSSIITCRTNSQSSAGQPRLTAIARKPQCPSASTSVTASICGKIQLGNLSWRARLLTSFTDWTGPTALSSGDCLKVEDRVAGREVKAEAVSGDASAVLDWPTLQVLVGRFLTGIFSIGEAARLLAGGSTTSVEAWFCGTTINLVSMSTL